MKINKVLFAFIKILFSVMVILLVIQGAKLMCSMGYNYGYRLYTEPAMEAAPGTDVLVQIKEQMSCREIAELMEEKGLVRDSELFYVQLKLSGYQNSIKPGLYTLNTSMEPKQLMIAMSPEPETEDGSTETEGGSTEAQDSEADEEEP